MYYMLYPSPNLDVSLNTAVARERAAPDGTAAERAVLTAFVATRSVVCLAERDKPNARLIIAFPASLITLRARVNVLILRFDFVGVTAVRTTTLRVARVAPERGLIVGFARLTVLPERAESTFVAVRGVEFAAQTSVTATAATTKPHKMFRIFFLTFSLLWFIIPFLQNANQQ